MAKVGIHRRVVRDRAAGGLALLALALGCAGEAAARPSRKGLAVGRGGVLLKDGKPYRGVGVNYFDAFYRTLKDHDDTSYREGFAELARRGIPFARFMCCGFWPKENALYLNDKARYFELLDGVVRSAEEHGIGLVPSLFWHVPTVPDVVGEPVDQWGNPRSKVHEFMRTYVREVVTRYRGSPAVWGWEFGNEMNLGADLPNASEHRPQVVPDLGTPDARSARDEMTHDIMTAALRAFAREVRRHDPHRFITSGNSSPRPSAWHQWKERIWAQDSEKQHAERLLLDHPRPVDTVSVHVYEDVSKRFGRELAVAEYLRSAARAARGAGRPLFIGEFGARGERDGDTEAAVRGRFRAILSGIEGSGAPLAALWVYDFGGQRETWNVTPSNARAWQLDEIAAANRRLRSAAGEPAKGAAKMPGFLVGADISMLDRIEEAGVVFRDGGRKGDLVEIMTEGGWNAFRLRLFVAPNHENQVVNDLEYTLKLAKRVKAAGGYLLLDLHYSDTWADPSHQNEPAAWKTLSFEETERRIEDYTASVIARFRREKVLPDMVQVGNEITTGMVWPKGRLYAGGDKNDEWRRFAALLKAGIRGVKRPLRPGDRVRIMVHIDRGGDRGGTKWFFDRIAERGVEFDVIGLSFYPWWHGTLDALRENLAATAADYGKPVVVVETAYPRSGVEWWGKQKNMSHPITPEGQADFLRELARVVRATPEGRGIGFFYWYPEAVPAEGLEVWNGGATGLFDRDGNALPAAKAFAGGGAAAKKKPLLLASYYVWYRSGRAEESPYEGWSRPNMRIPAGAKRPGLPGEPWIASTAYPLAGLYDSADADVAEWHVRLAKAAGIDAFLVSWWGEHLGRDRAFEKGILPAAERLGFKVALLDERAQFHRDLGEYKAMAAKFLRKYKDSPAYLHIDGEPAIYLYQVAAGPSLTPAKFAEIKGHVESEVGPVYWIVDKLAHDAKAARRGDADRVKCVPEEWLRTPGVDAFASYGTFSHFRAHAYDELAGKYRHLVESAHAAGKRMLLPVHPGHDNSRFGENPYVMPRRDGATLRDYLRAADDAGADFVMVTSWNEWPETTVVEPSRTWADPYAYLRILAEWKGVAFGKPPRPPKAGR